MPFVSLLCHKFIIRKFILPFLSLVMETNLFTRLKLCTPISNIYIYIYIYIYITVAELPAIFTNADTRIKEVQTGDREIKQ